MGFTADNFRQIDGIAGTAQSFPGINPDLSANAYLISSFLLAFANRGIGGIFILFAMSTW